MNERTPRFDYVLGGFNRGIDLRLEVENNGTWQTLWLLKRIWIHCPQVHLNLILFVDILLVNSALVSFVRIIVVMLLN